MKLEFGNHQVTVHAQDHTLVSLDGVPSKVLAPGTHQVKLRQFQGEVSFDSKKKVDTQVKSKLSQPGEKVDDLAPPAPPPADNFLAMMRHKVRQQMGVQRENFGRQLSPYETDTFQWEEEMIELSTATPGSIDATSTTAEGETVKHDATSESQNAAESAKPVD